MNIQPLKPSSANHSPSASNIASKWQRELDYRLIKEAWTSSGNRIAVRFACEWLDFNNNWFRSYGNENWEFDESGLVQKRFASINILAIGETDRAFFWSPGRCPDDHPGLTELEF